MMHKNRSNLFTMLVVVVLGTVEPSCAAFSQFMNSLPTVVNYIGQAQTVLRMIDLAVDTAMTSGGVSADALEKYRKAMAATYAGIDVAQRVLNGASDLNQNQIDDAFKQFREAYASLQEVLKEIGLVHTGGRLQLSYFSVAIPDPIVIQNYMTRHGR